MSNVDIWFIVSMIGLALASGGVILWFHLFGERNYEDRSM